MGELRTSQLETLRMAERFPDGIGAWELAAFGPGGNSIRSGESRLARLEESGHLKTAPYCTYILTDKGRAQLQKDTKDKETRNG